MTTVSALKALTGDVGQSSSDLDAIHTMPKSEFSAWVELLVAGAQGREYTALADSRGEKQVSYRTADGGRLRRQAATGGQATQRQRRWREQQELAASQWRHMAAMEAAQAGPGPTWTGPAAAAGKHSGSRGRLRVDSAS